ncbi:hypothetical protein [Paenarthrobacter aurescens]|uniref:Lipoprotein n=1 Tax=Paenarthrobacter aurescens TaxID=43663 RepID=A0A4Y3N7L4_PAEAU|nr:hypothetical protein [Paenarthrobacter aurescens]MDO6144579.1 hypothetical protein [Paenarthrobacter aurescens]MDO6148424.1 hypothetical protein [Paenarthrobacter aurescens]MDO6159670.1 hypothetical protein [Paenarthrobacter aurescens]MDO6164572.1 hypothetical protein [Paenarthrobacter aurescens]GEB17760.1 hypothetical protein AAU01_05150 [Paenarthrobacter aurescens]
MKYNRSGTAKYATLATLAVAITVAVCAPSAPADTNSFTASSGEVSQFPAASVAEALAAPISEQVAPSQTAPAPAAQQAEVIVPVPVVITPAPSVAAPAPVVTAPAPVVTAPAPAAPADVEPFIPAPPVVPAPQATIPPSTVAPAAPEPAPITPTEPSTPHVSPDFPVSGLYTFPDGHISFLLPAGWTAQTEVIPMDFYGDGRQTVDAHIYDETGTEVALIASGVYGGVVAGPVNRTILDSQQLTNFDNRDGVSNFAFFKDEYPFDPAVTRYFMGVVTNEFMTEGPESASAHSFLIMGNGASIARANMEVSMTVESAAAWMESEQYSKLKALLTSLQYAE